MKHKSNKILIFNMMDNIKKLDQFKKGKIILRDLVNDSDLI